MLVLGEWTKESNPCVHLAAEWRVKAYPRARRQKVPLAQPHRGAFVAVLYIGRSASQNAISANFDARFERFGLCFPTIKIARANAARGANDPRCLVLLLTFSHHEVMTGQT